MRSSAASPGPCERPGFRLVHYSLQGNHAHLVVEADDRGALGRGMIAIASRLARAVNRIARRRGPVLADRYHVRLLATPREVHRVLRYVLLNARRHMGTAIRRVAHPGCDPASSARWFDGWRAESNPVTGRMEPAARGTSPVARVKTWLLTVGWRLHGMLDPSAVPGRCPRPRSPR